MSFLAFMTEARAKSLAFLASIVVVGVILGLIMQIVDSSIGAPPLLHFPSNLLGLPLVAVGSWLRFWAGSVFYEHNQSMISLKAPTKLITNGPWKYSRNPLYLGLISIGLGLSILFASYSDLLLTIVGMGLLDLQVRREEKLLSKAFGKPYLDYKKRVRRWI